MSISALDGPLAVTTQSRAHQAAETRPASAFRDILANLDKPGGGGGALLGRPVGGASLPGGGTTGAAIAELGLLEWAKAELRTRIEAEVRDQMLRERGWSEDDFTALPAPERSAFETEVRKRAEEKIGQALKAGIDEEMTESEARLYRLRPTPVDADEHPGF